MVRFQRSRLDRVERHLRPAAPKYHDLSKLDDSMKIFCRAEGDARKAAEREMNNEMRKIYGLSSNRDVLKCFFYF